MSIFIHYALKNYLGKYMFAIKFIIKDSSTSLKFDITSPNLFKCPLSFFTFENKLWGSYLALSTTNQSSACSL